MDTAAVLCRKKKKLHYLFIAVVLTLFISFLRLLNASNNTAVAHDNSKGEVGPSASCTPCCFRVSVGPQLCRK